MYLIQHSVFQILFIINLYVLLSCYHVGTSTILSPSGMVSICPGGQVLLTCEIIAGPFLYWNVFAPYVAITRMRIVTNQGVLSQREFRIGFTEFSTTLKSPSPLISQLLISNVTTEINGSTIYCSEDGNENNATMTAINVINKDDALQSADYSLNVSLVNQLLTNNNVTVTLQWFQEAGIVYHVNVLPENLMSHTEFVSHDTTTINLTLSYNIQYNVSIVSSLCGVTTTKVLNYVTCDSLPIQLLYGNAIVVTGPASPPIEGQFITYSCPSGFILNGPNSSVCTRKRKWEPDPGQVECIADCGVPPVDRNVKLNYSSTLDGSVLTLTCENDMPVINSTDENILNVMCHSNGSWIPNPAEFTCSSTTTLTTLPGWSNKTSENTLLIIQISLTIFVIILIILFIPMITLCAVKKMRVAKKTAENPNQQQPTCAHEEITRNMLMEDNTAYGHVTYASGKAMIKP